MKNNTLEKFLNWPEDSDETEAPSDCLFNLQKALDSTLCNAQTYLLAHSFDELEGSEEAMGATVKFALGRLEWLLDEGRQQISGKFSHEEFVILLDCYKGDFLTQKDCQTIATTVRNERSMQPVDTKKLSFARFVDRLRALTKLQRAALADAIEVAWYSGRPVNEALADLGIRLR